ncbi:MAG: NCS2 family permease [Candidatus Saccharibacteria bacterium]|nr:NCS2 family permease [Candidatus Saccharibacteria bacterium]
MASTKQASSGILEQKFHISARNSSLSTEFISGTAIFMSMIYIIPVSSGMYAAVGVDPTLASIAIALVTCIISILMGLMANLPIALSTGMGLNAFAVFTICMGMGYPYELVMICTLVEGIIFLILTLTEVRSKLAEALPHNLKMFIGAGIGGFLAYIGAQNAHLIVGDASTLTTLVNFRNEFSTQGICALLALIGLMIIVILSVMKVKAAIVIGIFASWILGMICQAMGIYVPNIEAGYYSLYPSFSLPHISSLGGMFLTSSGLSSVDGGVIANIIIITLTMFYSDFFDTIGTCMTCIEKIKMQMSEEMEALKAKKFSKGDANQIEAMEGELEVLGSQKTTKFALLADAIGTIIGSLFKCTTITSFVESGAGIESGGRTGLSAIVTGAWFFLAIFFASIFTSIPGFATGPALIMVGCSMLISAMKQVEWKKNELHQIIPGMLCIVFMMLTYNIANGMAAAIIAYAVVSVFTGHKEEPKPLMYVLAVLLIAKFAFL